MRSANISRKLLFLLAALAVLLPAIAYAEVVDTVVRITGKIKYRSLNRKVNFAVKTQRWI